MEVISDEKVPGARKGDRHRFLRCEPRAAVRGVEKMPNFFRYVPKKICKFWKKSRKSL